MEKEIQKASAPLKAYSLKLTGNKPDADDLFQDTMVNIYKHIDKFQEGTNFKSWSYTIMRNRFINEYRRRKSRSTQPVSAYDGYILEKFNPCTRNEGDEIMSYKELVVMVNSLPEDLKKPFWMLFMGYKYTEIAEKLGTPLGTVKSKIFFARKKLRNTYTNYQALQFAK